MTYSKSKKTAKTEGIPDFLFINFIQKNNNDLKEETTRITSSTKWSQKNEERLLSTLHSHFFKDENYSPDPYNSGRKTPNLTSNRADFRKPVENNPKMSKSLKKKIHKKNNSLMTFENHIKVLVDRQKDS